MQYDIKTCAILYAGGGLADIGLKQAGLKPIWAVEYDADIAAVYAANHGPHVIVGDVRGVDFTALEAPDLLWASPPCPNFSVAKTGRGETEADLDMARAVARALETLRPRCFVLENVEGYAHSQSYRLICDALLSLDYWSDAEVVNAADLGVPQTRRRLILRARAGGWMQPSRPWPAPLPWVGWYAAIEDLIPTLPESAFAPWQLKRLPEEIRESVMLPGGGNTNIAEAIPGKGARSATTPAHTVTTITQEGGMFPRALLVSNSATEYSDGTRAGAPPALATTAQHGGRLRALLMRGDNSQQEITPERQYRRDWEPCPTVRTSAEPRAAVAGRVVAMTPRALARFQGLPDSYILPDKKALACKVIGNGVPPEVARVAALTLKEAPHA